MAHHTNHAATLLPTPQARHRELRVAAAAILLERFRESDAAHLDPWQSTSGFRLRGTARTGGTFTDGTTTVTATLSQLGGGAFLLDTDGESARIDGVSYAATGFAFSLDGTTECARVLHGHRDLWVKSGRGTTAVHERAAALKRRDRDHRPDAGEIRSPLPGKVVKIAVVVGHELNPGDTVLVIESMKMEHVLKAPAAGKVKAIKTLQGDVVEAHTVLVELDF